MSNDLVVYKSKGLTEDEAKLVVSFNDRGRPGVSKLKADVFESLYVLGYSCQDMVSQFPEYDLAMLLWARVKYDWDAKRTDYRVNLAKQTAQAMSLSQSESVRFLYDLMTATHVKNRTEIMRYLAAPDREKPPEFLPTTLHQYTQIIKALSELNDSIKGVTSGSNGGTSNIPLMPVVAINVSTNPATKEPAIEIRQTAKDVLLRKAGRKSDSVNDK